MATPILATVPEFETWRTLKVPMNVDASCGKKWPEIGPDQGVGDTQNQGLQSYTEGVIIDAEASIDKQYFMGMDIGFEKDTTVMAEGHVEDGKLVIDRIIQPKPELGNPVL
jgi:hypothetical protein